MNIPIGLLSLLALLAVTSLRGESEETISIDTPDTTAGELARAVADVFALNIVMPDALAEQKIGLKLRDVSWRTVFKIAYEPLGYAFYEEDNVVTFTNNREFMARMADSELLNLRRENKRLKAKIHELEQKLKSEPAQDSESAMPRVIRSPGQYQSPKNSTSLRISADENPKATFSHTGVDGRVTKAQILLDGSSKWACYIEGEMTLWVYRGGDTILAITIVPGSDDKLDFITSKRIYNLATELNEIPRPLVDVIRQ